MPNIICKTCGLNKDKETEFKKYRRSCNDCFKGYYSNKYKLTKQPILQLESLKKQKIFIDKEIERLEIICSKLEEKKKLDDEIKELL